MRCRVRLVGWVHWTSPRWWVFKDILFFGYIVTVISVMFHSSGFSFDHFHFCSPLFSFGSRIVGFVKWQQNSQPLNNIGSNNLIENVYSPVHRMPRFPSKINKRSVWLFYIQFIRRTCPSDNRWMDANHDSTIEYKLNKLGIWMRSVFPARETETLRCRQPVRIPVTCQARNMPRTWKLSILGHQMWYLWTVIHSNNPEKD